MAAFNYVALDRDGRQVRGLEEAESAKQARRTLRERGLNPVDIAESHAPSGKDSAPVRNPRRLSGDDRILFTQLLATLLDSGLPLDDALGAIAKQSSSKHLEALVLALRARVREGYSLEKSLGFFPAAFPEDYAATIGAGEQTRYLPLILRRMSEHLERRQEIQQRIRVASIYPAILVVVSLLVVGGLLTFVVPEVVKVFINMDQQLPLITRSLIAVSDFTASYGIYLFAAVLGSGLAWRGLRRKQRVRRALHRLALRLPLFGALVSNADGARFARTLSVLLSSGVNMVPAVTICARSASNLCIRELLERASARVREGENLSTPLAEAAVLPPLLVHLIANGETSGELTKMLDTAAAAQERSVQTQISVMLGLIEPLLILTMGAIVFVIVLGILLPIFDMNQLL